MTEIEPGGSPTLRVHEDGEPRLAQLHGELRQELVRGQHVGAGQPRIGRDRFGDAPAHGVVAPQRVAVADDEDTGAGRHRTSSSSTARSGPRSWTRSGISPSAWVEHDRHGS